MNNHMQVSLKSSTMEMNLNSHEEGIYIVPELEGLTELPSIRSSVGVNAGADGGWTSAQFFDARLISMRLVIANEDISVVETKRQMLNSLLAQGRTEELLLKLTTEGGNAYEINVRTSSVSSSLDRVLKKQDFLIQFRADDPIIYGTGEGGGIEAILTVQKALGGFEIPFEFPLAIGGGGDSTTVTNVGSEMVYPIIALYGNLHSPTIINRTTNQQLQIIADLSSEIIWGQYQTAEGAYITVNNALDREAPLADFQLKGNATQSGTPTPDAPISVQTVTGENVLNITGKNLFSGQWSQFDNVGGTGSLYAYFGLATDGDYRFTLVAKNGIPTQSVSRYIGFSSTGGGASDGYILWAYAGTAGSTAGQTRSIPNYVAGGGKLKYLSLYPKNQDTLEWFVENFDIQLELGSQATAYEPYQGQSYEINLGKNLLQPLTGLTNSGLTGVVNADGSVTATGTATLTYSFITNNSNQVLPAGTYVYSDGLDKTSAFRGMLQLRLADNTTQTVDLRGQDAGRVFTLTQPTSKVQVYVSGLTAGTTYDFTIYPMIEKGSTATTYAPYFAPIELAKIGDYQDKIYKDEGKWYVEKQVGKVVIDGSNGTYSRTGTNRFNVDITLGYKLWTGDKYYLSDTYEAFEQKETNSEFNTLVSNVSYAFDFSSGSSTIRIKDSNYDVLNDYKSWLSSHPVSFYYALATPTTTEITEQALIDQLDAILAQGELYTGTNNITTVIQAGNAQGEIEIGYYTEYEKQTDVVVIDSQQRTIALNGLDIYHLMTEESEFITIAPGENTLLLTSTLTSDDGYAEVKYKQGYLSI